MIAGFKTSAHPNELYSERVRATRWFAENQPDDFELHGFGWPGSFRPRFNRYLELLLAKARLNHFVDLFFPKNTVYRGPVKRKRDILSQFRFAICFENCLEEEGYLTEKLFDCMGAGCVPVYRGARNIRSLVPDDCYIDMQKFRSYGDLYAYLNSLDKATVRTYQVKMKEFMNSQRGMNFTPAYFARTLADYVRDDI